MSAARAPCTHRGVHRLCRELFEGGQLSPRSWGLLPGVWNGQEWGGRCTWRVRKASQDDLAVNQARKGKARTNRVEGPWLRTVQGRQQDSAATGSIGQE